MLIRFTRSVSFVNAYPVRCGGRFGGRQIQAGEVFEEYPLIGCGVRSDDFHEVRDPRDGGLPATVGEVAVRCGKLLGWVAAGHLPGQPSMTLKVVQGRLLDLSNAAAMLPDALPTPFDAGAVRKAQTLPDLVRLTKRLQQWAAEGLTEQPTVLHYQRAEQPPAPSAHGRMRPMLSAAKDTTGVEKPARLPGPDAHPVEVVRFGPEALEQFGAHADDQALTPDDIYILTILGAHKPKSRTYRQIAIESVRRNRDDRDRMRRLNDSVIRNRAHVLLQLRLVARPPGTQRQGIAITSKGIGVLLKRTQTHR